MTCIIGMKHDGAVTLASDSAGTDDRFGTMLCATPKVFTRHVRDQRADLAADSVPFVFGTSSSFRVGQVLQYGMDVPIPPPRADEDELYTYVVTEFLAAYRGALDAAGALRAKEGEQSLSGNIIMGVHGRLFVIQEDFGVIESTDDYAAIGIGETYALGAMYALKHRRGRSSVRDLLTLALDATCAHNVGCRPPYTFATTDTTRPTGKAGK